MKLLTRAEELVMQTVWSLGSGLLMEIVDKMPEPQPHKNTVATILKTLTEKGFITVESIGRIHKYHPAINKEVYSGSSLSKLTKSYFNGSFRNVVSFLVDDQKLSVDDLELLLKEIKEKK